MAGKSSQFYSLRTGGHYRIFHGHPEGIRQVHFAMNHWVISDSGEPIVQSITLPFIVSSVELFVDFTVREGWGLEIKNAIALAPILQHPRKNTKLEFKPIDVLQSEFANFTFHVCWTKNAHESFVVSTQEPRFAITDWVFEKFPHSEVTMNAVRDAFLRMSDFS